MAGLRSSVIVGTAWAVALRWFLRVVGLINVAILARILGPADFGLVAMATLVIGLIEMWLAFGVDSALIQNVDADRDDFDTAWTIRLLQGCVIAAIVIVSAPLAQVYFREPRLEMLLWALAPGVVLSGLTNIGVVMFTKSLQFHKDFQYKVTSKLLAFAISVASALWLRNYWALAIGIVGGYGATCVVSYVVQPYRPRLSLKRWRKLWSFSQWMLVMNVVGYAAQKADEVLVGRYTSAAQMGLYSVASDIGQMPSAELAAPVNRVLFAAFSQLQTEPGRLAAAYCNALATVCTVTVPAGVGLALVAPEVVSLVLGAKWSSASPLLAILALWGTIRSLWSSGVYLLISIGHPRHAATITAATLALFCVGAGFVIVGGGGAYGIALVKLALAGATCVLMAGYLVHFTAVRVGALIRSVFRPIASTVVMAAVVHAIPSLPIGQAASLAAKVGVGAMTYIAVLLIAWRMAGCPDGPERTGIAVVKRRLLQR